MADFDIPETHEFPVIPTVMEGVMSHSAPFLAKEQFQEPLGFPGNGELIWQQRVGRGGLLGGIHWGMAVNEALGILYVPVSDRPSGTPSSDARQPGLHAVRIDDGELRARPLTHVQHVVRRDSGDAEKRRKIIGLCRCWSGQQKPEGKRNQPAHRPADQLSDACLRV